MQKYSSLAERIKSARNQAHLSHARLGKEIGLSDKSISAYEKGRSVPPLTMLKKIASYTQKPLTYFTDEEEYEEGYLLEKLALIENELLIIKDLLQKGKKNS